MSIGPIIGRELDRSRVRWFALGSFLVVALLLVFHGGPLTWDGAVYSARGNDLATSNFDWEYFSGQYWGDWRAPGLPTIQAVFFEIFGISDIVARTPVVLASTGLLWALARSLDVVSPKRVGTTAIIVVGICPGFLATSTLAFADHVAAFFVVTACWAALDAYVHRRTGPLVWLPLGIALATTIRFGSFALAVAPLTVVGVLVIRDALRDRDLMLFWRFLWAGAATAGLVIALLFTTLLTRVESPSNATSTLVDAGARPLSEGFRDLRELARPGPVWYGFNGAFWGWSYALLFAALFAFAVFRLLAGRRFALGAALVAIATTPFVLYAVLTRQFVTTYASPLFAIAAAAVAAGCWSNDVPETEPSDVSVEPAADSRPPSTRRYSTGQAAALVLLVAIVLVVSARSVRSVSNMHARLGGDEISLVARAADASLGAPCRLVTVRVPAVSWYSDCFAAGPADPSGSADPDGAAAYLELEARRAPGAAIGLFLVDGFTGQAQIDDVWAIRDVDRSMMLVTESGRRVALVAIP